MPKKIFDITPPSSKPDLKPRPQFPKPAQKIAGQAIGFKLTVGGVVLALVAAALLWIFIEPKAIIEIWPTIEAKKIKTQAVLQGEIFPAQNSLPQGWLALDSQFQEEKARGNIKIYNNYSTNSQPLVARTRFVSSDGKLFRMPKRVVVPGGHYEGGKLVAGTLDIEVVADQPGEDFNIGPSTFSIPGFAGTSKYTAFYAKSFEPMSGGIKKEMTLAFKKSDLETFASNYILSQGPAGKELYFSSLELQYTIENSDFEQKEVTLNIEATAGLYTSFDLEQLRGSLQNKHPDEVRAILQNFSEIDRARMELWPFWASKSPQDPQRIEIKLKL